MGALLNPVNRTRGSGNWLLVAHTVAMFAFVTINTGISLNIQSIVNIDNRKFPGADEIPPGPYGYQFIALSQKTNFTPSIMFLLNQWLADGLLVSLV